MSIRLLNHLATALAVILVSSTSHAADAADETTDEDEDLIEEIIVTATYRDSRLMDTPLAISAVTSEDIAVKGIEDIQTLYTSIPGLSYRGSVGTGGAQLSIRGITPSTTPGSVGAVGVYLDNLPITDSAIGGRNPLGSVFDMDRVEVLKGPQGTLYGEGSMGGNIRYITNKPDTSGLDYHVRSSFENMSKSDDLSYRIDAMVNIPLADQLALRLVGYRRDRAGVLDTVAPRNGKDVDWFEENGLRAALKWDASKTFEVTAKVNVVDSDYGGPELAFHCYTEAFDAFDPPGGQVPGYLAGTGGGVNNAAPDSPCPPGKTDTFDHGDPYVTHLAHPAFVNGGFDDQTSYNLTIDWELPFADLLSSTSYFERVSMAVAGEGPPGPPAGFFNFANAVFGPGAAQALGGGGYHLLTERIVQELRLISNTDGPLQWTLGAYYKDDASQQGLNAPCYKGGGSPVYAALDICTSIFGFSPDVSVEDQARHVATLLGVLGVGAPINFLGFREQAIYGEVSYRLSDQWEIQLGLRLAEVEHQLTIGQRGANSKADPTFDLIKSSDIKAPKATLAWRPIEGWMIFATYSEGFRPGIINTRIIEKHALLQGVIDDGVLSEEALTLAQNQIDRTIPFRTAEGDFVENTELGIKASVLGGRLSFTGSYYHIAFDDYVLRILDRNFPRTGGLPGRPRLQYGVNVGDAKSRGLELEVRWALTDNLLLTFGGDKSFEANLTGVPEGAGVCPTDSECRAVEVRGITPGARMSNAPEDSYYASLAYDFELFGKNATARADTYYVPTSLDNTARAIRYSKPAYRTTDVKLMVNLDNWMLSAYVRNVTDEKIVYEFREPGYYLGRPRSLGVQINYRR